MSPSITVEKLEEDFNAFIDDVKKFEKNGNKSAARRARINSVEFRETLKDWRQETLQ